MFMFKLHRNMKVSAKQNDPETDMEQNAYCRTDCSKLLAVIQ